MFKKDLTIFNESVKEAAETKTSNENMSYYVAEICQRYTGLSELLLFIRKWIQKHNIKNIPTQSLDALFIAYGLGELQKSTGGWLVVSYFVIHTF
uniref:Uncharacterized protein n=1 Tax=Panagrolaimus sp. ES5 TaxID=591445 RepID=A0AC34G975_9BILA